MNERRISQRQKSFLKGVILFNKRTSSVDCTVRDLSPGGARVVIAPGVTIPEFFEFHIPSKDQYLDARQVWRTPNELGLAFGRETESPALAAEHPPEDLASRVGHLEAEVDKLRRGLLKLRSDFQRNLGDRELAGD